MSAFEEIVETGFGAVVLSFGTLAGAAVYSNGSIGVVPGVADRFGAALWLAFVPALSVAAWPNVVGLLCGVLVAVELEESISVRVGGFLAAYIAVAVGLYYVTTPV